MINFVIAVALLALPILLLIMWRKYFAGMLIGQAVFVVAFFSYVYQAELGGQGWIANYPIREAYVVRWMLPTFVQWLAGIVNVEAWLVWLFLSSAIWWLGLCLFQQILSRIGFCDKLSTLGAILPMLTFASAYGGGRLLMSADGLNWLVVLGIAWATYRITKYKELKWWGLLPLLMGLALVVSFPVPTGAGWHTRLDYFFWNDPVELLAGGGVYWLFIGLALLKYRNQIPDFVKLNRGYLILIGLVMVVATDWDRWFVLSGFLWVPLVLISLKGVGLFGN